MSFLMSESCSPVPLTQACTTDVRAIYEWQAICNARILSARAKDPVRSHTNLTAAQEIPEEQPFDWTLLNTGVSGAADLVNSSAGYVETVWGTTTAGIPDTITIDQLDNPSWKASIVPGLLPTAALGLTDSLQKHTLQVLLASTLGEWQSWAGFSGQPLSKEQAVMLLVLEKTLGQMGGQPITFSPVEAGPRNPDGPVLSGQSAQMPSASEVMRSASADPSRWPLAAPYPDVDPFQNASALPGREGMLNAPSSQPIPYPSTMQYNDSGRTNATAVAEQFSDSLPFIVLPFTGDLNGMSYSPSLQRLGNKGAFDARARFPTVPQNRDGMGYSRV
jgi:hypothetical protein